MAFNLTKNVFPVLSDRQAEELEARAGHFGMRCFFGIHEKVEYLWPINGPVRVSRHITCIRCGSTLDILLLSERKY